jgi:hydrogenase-4 component F
LFLSAGNIFLKYSSTKIANVRGVLTASPVTGMLFLAGFFAITGTPPFGIFFTKIFIISAGLQSHPWAGVAIILLTVILFVDFFKQVVAMVFGDKPEAVKSGELSFWLVTPPLVLITTALVLSFYVPPFLFKLINMAVLQY